MTQIHESIIKQLGAKIANLEIEKATIIANFEAYRQEVEKNGDSQTTEPNE